MLIYKKNVNKKRTPGFHLGFKACGRVKTNKKTSTLRFYGIVTYKLTAVAPPCAYPPITPNI
jgi:hypothetical protein